jgi:hypothetical protein
MDASLFAPEASLDELACGVFDAYDQARADAAFMAHMRSVFPAHVLAAAADEVSRRETLGDLHVPVILLQRAGFVPAQPFLRVLLCAALWQNSLGGRGPAQKAVKLILLLPMFDNPATILRAMQPYHVGELTIQHDAYGPWQRCAVAESRRAAEAEYVAPSPESFAVLRDYTHLRTLGLETMGLTDLQAASAVFNAALKYTRAAHVKIAIAVRASQVRPASLHSPALHQLDDGAAGPFASLAWPETMDELEVLSLGPEGERCLYAWLARSVAAATHIRSLRLRTDYCETSVTKRPEIFGGLDRLERLHLSRMTLDAADVLAIGRCRRLRSLVLESVSLVTSERDPVDDFQPALKQAAVALHSLGTSLPRLKEVSVSFTNGSAVPYVGLLNGLMRSATLRTVSLTNVPLLHLEPVDDTYLELLGALGVCCEGSVRELSLVPATYPHSTDDLIAFIGRHCGKLRRLSLPSLCGLSDEQHAELVQSLTACRQLDVLCVPFLSSVSRARRRAAQQTINDAKLASAISLLGSSLEWLREFHPCEATCSFEPGDMLAGFASLAGPAISTGQGWFSHYDDLFVRSREALTELARKRLRRATGRAWAVVAKGILRSQERRLALSMCRPSRLAIQTLPPRVLHCIGSFLPEPVELRIL